MTLHYRPWHELYTLTVVGPFGVQQNDIIPLIQDISVSYTMDMASQLSFTVSDINWKFSQANYFMLRREVLLTEKATNKQSFFEIAALHYEPGDVSNIPKIGVECRARAIQEMKRDKKPEAFSGISATEYASIIAERHGLKIYGESTNAVQTIAKSRSSNSDESVWDILKRLAEEHQFVRFESAGTLFFCSERFLLGKLGTGTDFGTQLVTKPAWPGNNGPLVPGDNGKAIELLEYYFNLTVTGVFGAQLTSAVRGFQQLAGLPVTGQVDIITWNKIFGTLGFNWTFIPLVYPPTTDRFMVLEHPSVRSSDDSPYEAEGDAVLARDNATQLLPGMTVSLDTPNPHINGAYIINSVSYTLGGPDPVKIAFRTPAQLEPKKTGSTTYTGA